MVQGKFKAKKSLPNNIKQKSEHRVQKAIEKKKEHSKVNKQKKTIKNVIKGNLENEVNKNIESELASRAKGIEGKSFNLLK